MNKKEITPPQFSFAKFIRWSGLLFTFLIIGISCQTNHEKLQGNWAFSYAYDTSGVIDFTWKIEGDSVFQHCGVFKDTFSLILTKDSLFTPTHCHFSFLEFRGDQMILDSILIGTRIPNHQKMPLLPLSLAHHLNLSLPVLDIGSPSSSFDKELRNTHSLNDSACISTAQYGESIYVGKPRNHPDLGSWIIQTNDFLIRPSSITSFLNSETCCSCEIKERHRRNQFILYADQQTPMGFIDSIRIEAAKAASRNIYFAVLTNSTSTDINLLKTNIPPYLMFIPHPNNPFKQPVFKKVKIQLPIQSSIAILKSTLSEIDLKEEGISAVYDSDLPYKEYLQFRASYETIMDSIRNDYCQATMQRNYLDLTKVEKRQVWEEIPKYYVEQWNMDGLE